MSAIKILLDTDIGSDIDDAACLAYLLMQPRCDLLGITTVSGEADLRAALCSALCQAAGKGSIPIFPGAQLPLLTAAKQPLCAQATKLTNWPHDTAFPQNAAVDFLRDTILAHRGQVHLLAIGPMTNVALLFATYPDVVKELAGLTLMCGRFGNGIARMPLCEWNALNDPFATAIVYNAPVLRHRSVGLDVTLQVRMDADQVRARFDHPLLRLVKDFSGVWFDHADVMTFHDPLAAVALFDEDLLGFERGDVSVETTSAPLMGLTHYSPNARGAHEIATQIDAARFFTRYFSVFA